MMADEKVKDSVWTREQDIAFENALVTYPDEDAEDRWEKIAAEVPGEKSADEIKSHYELLLEDLDRIESGVVPLPLYGSSLDDSESQAGEGGTSKKAGQNTNESNHGGKASKADQERRKGIAWTEDEHRLFLLGLGKYGKGDWRSISRNFVVTRTPTQVASHAQKYFIRLNSMNKDRRRSSIHDITSVNNADVSVPQPPTNSSPAAASKSSKQPTGVSMYGGTTIGQPVVGTPVNLAAAPPHVAYGMGTPILPAAPPNMDPRPSCHR